MLENKSIRYIRCAILNWNSRLNQLVPEWSFTEDPARKEKLFEIVDGLEERLNKCCALLHLQEQLTMEDRLAEENMIITLVCENLLCRINVGRAGISLKYKDYQHEEVRCAICGDELVPKDQGSLRELFGANNISLN
jgi:hypothetical protein